ncbi:MAG TPA: ribonuclease P protein component [Candidatus Paceibacterota bacterium]|nr:ribonuclease P protein component [Candidatus Paceibacterota bacterium]
MLKRTSRLPREGFQSVAGGRRLIAPHFSISYRPGAGQGAVVVSKKAAPKSVDRHLVKRRVMDLIRPHIGHGVSFIVYARKGAAALPFRAIRGELEPLFATLHV